MKTRNALAKAEGSQSAVILVVVLVFAALSLTLLVSTLTWTSTSVRLGSRQNQTFDSAAAAEAATEKVLTRVMQDYANNGEGTVYNSISTYQGMLPSSSESSYWSGFEFSDGSGTVGGSGVVRFHAEIYTNLESQYAGLMGWASGYRFTSAARQINGRDNFSVAVKQEVQAAAIPVFQFAIFYGLDLELHSQTVMDIRGRVHCNKNIYTYPSATTTFWSDVTAVGDIFYTRKPGDPAYSTAPASGQTIFKGKLTTHVTTLNLPIGTNNTPAAVREVVNLPPSGEAANSSMGKQRYYNKSELVILVTNTTVTAFSRSPTTGATNSIAWTNLNYFITTNLTFTDQRESKVIRVTEIDIAKLGTWSKTNAAMKAAFGVATTSGPPVTQVYISDDRTVTSSQLTGIRLINGQTLPSNGLTIATPNPMYIKGHYNQPTTAYLGTTNTSTTVPASVVADAITILSANWLDASSALSYTTRVAANTTVNAALLAGIVETSTASSIYSGGAHNLGRFLESWTGLTFTCNGSMVVMYNSVRATAPFQQPGAYYQPPTRSFAFDQNFLDGAKLPPGTPSLRTIIRSKWAAN